MRPSTTVRTLEEYLRQCTADGVIDFAFRATPNTGGGFAIVVHPAEVAGETVDFEVRGNQLKTAGGAK